jgi:NADPH:quinone reductase-like Zn-dependent oxidoreductase
MKQNKMKAVICKKYGPPDVLQLAEVDRPVPKEDEILIEIKASAVTASDIFIRSSNVPLRVRIPMRLMLGIFKPRKKIIGLVFAGRVESAGQKIKRFSPGDEVYGMTGFNLGTYAEYTCIKETDSTTGCVSIKPKNISFEEATSAVYGGSLALQFMENGNIRANQNILIYGASGTSGSIAVQYGKYLGANVTAVCSGKHVDFVKSLGADYVIDYKVTDTLDEKRKFNFILDSVGKIKTSKLKDNCKKALLSDGKYASIDDGALKLSSKRLDLLTGLIEKGKIKPVVDKIFPLEEIVEAHRYVEKGHKKGGVAIAVEHNHPADLQL